MQKQLAQLAELVASRGIPVLISNHNTHFTQQAYQMATHRDTFQVRRYISCNGEKRRNAGEILALFI
jgi:DNA adenine methylase